MKPIANPIFRDHIGKEIPDIKAYVASWLHNNPNGEIYVGLRL